VSIADPILPGYAFLRWGVTCSNGTQLTLPAVGIPVGTTGDITLTAIWDLTPIQYNIVYNYNGGSVAPGAHPAVYNVENRGFITPDNLVTPTFAGRTFSYWRVYAGADSFTLTAAGIPIASLGDIRIVAMWELAPKRYSITYDLAGGDAASGNPTGYTIETNFPMPVHNPTRAGYLFTYWTVVCSSNGATFILPSTGIPADLYEDIKLVANWTPQP
jgi:uncharacterized repeat protein (TIGR02543 family)